MLSSLYCIHAESTVILPGDGLIMIVGVSSGIVSSASRSASGGIRTYDIRTFSTLTLHSDTSRRYRIKTQRTSLLPTAIIMPILRFSGKRAGETDIMDEAGERRLYTSRTFIAGNVKTAIYKCVEDESGSSEGQFLARLHTHAFSSDELEIGGASVVKTRDCLRRRANTMIFTTPSGRTYQWKPEDRGYLLSDGNDCEVARVHDRSFSFHSDRRRRRTMLSISSDAQDLDEVVVVCLYCMIVKQRRGIIGGALGESIGLMLTISLAPTGFLRW
ncbi:hypothetical protein PENSPDRAFT_759094 [Peniophora sp. CONT]|nr:hypothetical protein PENSPDRAFT_759094 [Peniophora sp. CONT]